MRAPHAQVGLGLERPWFPAWALSLPVADTRIAAVVRGTGLPLLRAAEDRLRPRLGFVAGMLGRAPLAVLVAVLGHPFGSQLKATPPPPPGPPSRAERSVPSSPAALPQQSGLARYVFGLRRDPRRTGTEPAESTTTRSVTLG
jgi:hypothetical protein